MSYFYFIYDEFMWLEHTKQVDKEDHHLIKEWINQRPQNFKNK